MVVFCLIAGGLAAATGLVLQATGGLVDSLVLVPGTPVTLATVLLPSVYMFSPAVAHLLTRAITREGWSDLRLRPRINRRLVRIWALAWLGPIVLIGAGAAIYFVVFPAAFDPSYGAFRTQLAASESSAGVPIPLAPGLLLALQVGAALVVAPWINAAVAAGEEFGWRGYLLPKLVDLTGLRPALVISGIIWGCWHWPLILLGYEYGFGYWGAPWSGLLLFCVFTTAVGTCLAWLTLREGSIWPAALGHGALNSVAGLPLLFVAGAPNPLVGPATMGALALLPWLVVAVVLAQGIVRRRIH